MFAGPAGDITLTTVTKSVVSLAALVGALATLWFYQPFALALDVEQLDVEVQRLDDQMQAIKNTVALAEDLETVKNGVDWLKLRVELSDVRSEMREIGRVPATDRPAPMQERLVDLERQRRHLERTLAEG